MNDYINIRIPRWIMWVVVFMVGSVVGYSTSQLNVVIEEAAAYNRGHFEGFEKGQKQHCEESKASKVADWILDAREKE